MPLEALRPLALAWIFGMTGVLAWLWYKGRVTRTLAVAVLAISALLGFLFASIAPYMFQLLLLGNLISDNVVYPRVIGKRLGLHPLVIIFSLMAGGALLVGALRRRRRAPTG